jgi:GntR family transcriptional regulator
MDQLRVSDGTGWEGNTVIVEVRVDSPVAPYEQIRSQIAAMIHSGVAPPGHRLPPIRQLASDLGVAPGTVARAYRELEADHLIDTRGRHGSFVLAPSPTPDPDRGRLLDEAARAFAMSVAQLGVDPGAALDAVTTALEDLRDI